MLRKVALAALVFLLACSTLSFSAMAGKWFTVKHVSDGDTVYLSRSRALRYIGIDAPETARKAQKAQPFGDIAAQTNERLVLGKRVRIELDRSDRDRYGRMLAYVFLADGGFVNGMLVSEGLAWCLFSPPNTLRYQELLALQQEAMNESLGLWFNFQKKGFKCIGNSNSMRFHRPRCTSVKKTGQENRVVFPTMWKAFWNGYAPCKICLRNWQEWVCK